MLGFCKKDSGFSQVMGGVFSVCGVGYSALQSFKCVCVDVDITMLCVHIKLTFCIHHAQHSCFVFTALCCDCYVVNLHSIFTRPHLGLLVYG